MANSVVAERQPEIKNMLKTMQSLEDKRLRTMKQCVAAVAKAHEKLAEDVKTMTTPLANLRDSMQPQKDIEEFVGAVVAQHGPVPRDHFFVLQNPFSYDLDRTPQAIMEDQANEAREAELLGVQRQVGLFGNTLKGVLEFEKLANPHLVSPDEVPAIMNVLCNAVRQNNGFDQTGIFRISCTTSARESLRDQFEKGDYVVQSNDPHVPAGLLKEWLRELVEPVVPAQLYQNCVTLGRQENLKPTDPGLLRVLKALPSINFAVLKFLVELMRDIAAKEDVNKMSPHNLGVVFSPSVLRAPVTQEMLAENQQELMQEAQFACGFLVKLLDVDFDNLDNKDGKVRAATPAKGARPASASGAKPALPSKPTLPSKPARVPTKSDKSASRPLPVPGSAAV